MNDGWDDVRISRLKALWEQGLSAGEIMPIMNREFKSQYTRSAIIGKITRLKLPPRNPMLLHGGQRRNIARSPGPAPTAPKAMSRSPSQPPALPIPKRRTRPQSENPAIAAMNIVRSIERQERSPGLPQELEEPAVGTGIQLIELTNTTCRWPFGDPGTERFYFCGTHGADMMVGKPYCPFHTRKAENPAARSAKEFNRSAMHAASR